MATALQGRHPNETLDIKRAKDLGACDFQGSVDPVEAENWLTDLVRVFEVMRCPMEDRVRLATFILKGNAFYWWE